MCRRTEIELLRHGHWARGCAIVLARDSPEVSGIGPVGPFDWKE